MKRRTRARQKGYLLISALLALMVMSGLAIGLVYLVNTETSIGYSDEAGTLAYYGAEAALEKLSADLGKLYSTKQSPTASDIAALTASMPELGNSLKVTDYKIQYENANGNTTDASGNALTTPTVTAGTIGGNGTYAGLMAQIIKMLLKVTVTTSTGQQVQVSREVEVALIPVFQFGAFSDEDLAYHAGTDFDFGGRVHTNGNLFLASSSSAGTTLHAQVTAVKEVIRAGLQNGLSTSAANKTSAIWIPTAPNGCEGSKPACRELKLTEGSTSVGWSSVVSQYNGYLQNHVTALSLPFVGGGVPSFELLRRPNGESADSPLANSRMYYLAQIRILIDDSSKALTASSPTSSATVPKTSLKVEIRKSDGNWEDVTSSWLSRGITQSDADAILRFTASGGSKPINIYDPREGEPRDTSYSTMNATSTSKDKNGKLTVPALCSYAGTINTVELNVGNLRNWLLTDSVGKTTDYATQNGYVLYYSDQRGMLPNTDVPSSHPDHNRKAGYGFTDVTNPNNSAGTPNGVLDDGEALNRLPGYSKDDPLGFALAGYGSMNRPLTYGAKNLGDAFGVSISNPYLKIANNDSASQPSCLRAKLTWVSGARHALKLVNGSLGKLPQNPSDNTGGFTVASENPVYVQGNYNASGSGFSDYDGHAAAAILADTVTLLSNDWVDSNSFDWPLYPTNRPAKTQTFYRMAVATGKSLPFAYPSWASDSNVGLEGGVHNLLRFLEQWSTTCHYKGSLVSLFLVQYNTGMYKAGMYNPPTRDYSFDKDFQLLSKLPPGTPHFRDVVSLSFSQNYKPQ